MLQYLLWPPINLFWQCVSYLIHALVQISLIGTLSFTVALRMGWCHRVMWSFLEKALSDAMNGAHVTIGSFAIDLLRGSLILNNVIVHSPLRQKYQWESPVLCRFGTMRVEFNPCWILFAKFVLGDPSPPLDVTLLHVSDVQTFLERRDHVFNVYLLDRYFVPPAEEDKTEPEQRPATKETEDHPTESISKSSNPINNRNELILMNNKDPKLSLSNESDENPMEEHSASSVNIDQSNQNETGMEKDHERAEHVVGEMFKAVQSLGRAVQDGQLPQALQEQRQRITKSLKDYKGDVTSGLTLMQQISKMVVEKSHKAVTQSNHILQPKRHPVPPVARPVYARFGRVILDDFRVFTRTTVVEETTEPVASAATGTPEPLHIIPPSQGVEVTPVRKLKTPTHKDPSTGVGENIIHADMATATHPEQDPPVATVTSKPVVTTSKSYWNKPITVSRVAVRASEFGAPLNAKEDDTGFPLLFQPLEKSVDAVIKRLVGDMAKANTGRLVRTALGEVLDFYMEREYEQDANQR